MIRTILILLVLFWSLIMACSRFLLYLRIVRDYKNEADAKIIRVKERPPQGKRDPGGLDVTVSYEIEGEEKLSEFFVDINQKEKYKEEERVKIRYYVAENGAIHIASAGDGPKKLMYGYLFAIAIIVIVFIAVIILL